MYDKVDFKIVKKNFVNLSKKMGYSLMWNVDKIKCYVLENKFCIVVNNF